MLFRSGRVFKWIAPKDDIPQGNYEPVILLSTPKLVQLGTIAAHYEIKENTSVQAEFAFSNHDQNTFSKIDDKDNIGFAVKLLFANRHKLRTTKENVLPWYFKNQLNYEFLHKNFYTPESFREVEFARNYNLAEDYSQKNAEQMLHLRSEFEHSQFGNVMYDFNYFSRLKSVNAFRNQIAASIKKNGFTYITDNAFLLTNDSVRNTHFLKSNQYFSKSFKKIEIGLTDQLEYNIFKDQNTDSLLSNSYAFNEGGIFLKNNDSLPYLYHISFTNRINGIQKDNVLLLNSMNNEGKIAFELAKLKNNRIKGTATYRNSQVKDSTNRFSSENFFIGSIEYSGRFFKNAIVLTTYYEAGSGMEQKKTFSYLKVADGQGTHTWNDYNGNGIEELDEFEVAAFQDEANYIRIWINTTDYIVTYNNQFTQTLQLRPGNVWSTKKGFLKFLSRFGNTSAFQSAQKNTLKNSFAAFNPFQFNMNDSVLVRSNLNFANTLSFNQLSPYWGIDFIVRATQNKQLLFYGFENNVIKMQEVLLRGNPHKSITLKSNYSHSQKGYHSEYLAAKSYTIESHILENSILFSHKNALFTSLSYIYKQKRNHEGDEKAFFHQIDLNINFRMAKRGNLNANVQFININYNAETNNGVSYEMLEGLNNGNNALWTLAYQANITNYLQVELSYNGRSSSGNKAIHTGNLQLRAHF